MILGLVKGKSNGATSTAGTCTGLDGVFRASAGRWAPYWRSARDDGRALLGGGMAREAPDARIVTIFDRELGGGLVLAADRDSK